MPTVQVKKRNDNPSVAFALKKIVIRG